MTETELRKQRTRAYVRKSRYGITEDQYNNLLARQGNRCAVCPTQFSETVKPNVDHDHNCCPGTKCCGKCLRGLLCSNCLTVASMVETRFQYMDALFEYLTWHLNLRHEGGK